MTDGGRAAGAVLVHDGAAQVRLEAVGRRGRLRERDARADGELGVDVGARLREVDLKQLVDRGEDRRRSGRDRLRFRLGRRGRRRALFEPCCSISTPVTASEITASSSPSPLVTVRVSAETLGLLSGAKGIRRICRKLKLTVEKATGRPAQTRAATGGVPFSYYFAFLIAIFVCSAVASIVYVDQQSSRDARKEARASAAFASDRAAKKLAQDITLLKTTVGNLAANPGIVGAAPIRSAAR